MLSIHVQYGDLVKIEFHEFQEYGPQINASPAKLCIRRSDTEVGMAAEYHLAGRLGKLWALHVFGRKMAQSKGRFRRSDGMTWHNDKTEERAFFEKNSSLLAKTHAKHGGVDV